MKKILLKNSYGHLEQRQAFPITDEKIVFEFTTPDYALTNFVVIIDNGDKRATLQANGGVVELPEEMKFAGTLKMSAHLIGFGGVTKKWQIEPIDLYDLDGGLSGMPLLEELQTRVDALTSQNAYLAERLTALETAVGDLNIALEQ